MTKKKIKILLLSFILLAVVILFFLYKANSTNQAAVKIPNAIQKSGINNNLPPKDLKKELNLKSKKTPSTQKKETFPVQRIETHPFADTMKTASSPKLNYFTEHTQIPKLTIDSISTITKIHLDNYIKHKIDSAAYIHWQYESNNNLSINIDSVNTAVIKRKNYKWYGEDTLKFIASTKDGDTFELSAAVNVAAFFDPPELVNIQEQIISEGNNFNIIDLNDYILPGKEDNNVSWSCSGNKYLKIRIDSSGTASFNLPEEDWTGSDTVTFTATSLNNYSSSIKTIFSVRAISFFAKQPVKPIVNVLFAASNDVLSLITSPLNWDSTDFFIYPSIVIGTYLFMIGDQPIRNWISHYGTAKEIPIMKFGTYYGQSTTTQLSALSVFSFGLLFDNKEAMQIGLEIYESYFIANNITSVLKRIFGRDRPYENNGPYHFDPFPSRNNPINSFPSGHSTLAFSLSSVLAAHTDKLWLKAIIFSPAVITAVSRVYHNVHWFSDVFMGGAVGYLVGNYLVSRHNGNQVDHIHIGFDDYGRLNLRFNF